MLIQSIPWLSLLLGATHPSTKLMDLLVLFVGVVVLVGFACFVCFAHHLVCPLLDGHFSNGSTPKPLLVRSLACFHYWSMESVGGDMELDLYAKQSILPCTFECMQSRETILKFRIDCAICCLRM